MTHRDESAERRGSATKPLLAERPETLDLLRRHADRLVAEFRAAGFSEMNLGFGNLSAGEQGSHQPGPEPATREAFDSGIPAPAPMPDNRPASQASLYLRL